MHYKTLHKGCFKKKIPGKSQRVGKNPGKVVTLQKRKDRFSSPMNGFRGGTLGCFLFGGVLNLKRNSNSGTLHNHDMAWWASCFRCPRCLLFGWPRILGCVNSQKSRQKVSTDLSSPFFDLLFKCFFLLRKNKEIQIDWHFCWFFCSVCFLRPKPPSGCGFEIHRKTSVTRKPDEAPNSSKSFSRRCFSSKRNGENKFGTGNCVLNVRAFCQKKLSPLTGAQKD